MSIMNLMEYHLKRTTVAWRWWTNARELFGSPDVNQGQIGFQFRCGSVDLAHRLTAALKSMNCDARMRREYFLFGPWIVEAKQRWIWTLSRLRLHTLTLLDLAVELGVEFIGCDSEYDIVEDAME